MIKIASQFSGIGSFEQAIINLGIEHENIMAVDFDKYARQTYTANFGEPKHYFVDSYNADYENVENVDVFLSSPPCQSFSFAGKRLGESDPRGLLFFETLRFINCNKPKYFIIENVKGLLSDNSGKTFQSWIDLLGQSVNGNTFMFPHEDSLMYNLHWQVLNTKDYGLPQNRERVFLVGIRNDLPNNFVFPKGVPLKLRLKDILEDIVDEKYYLSEKTISYITKREGVYTDFNPEISRTICAQYAQSSNGSFIKSDNIIQVGNVNPSGNGMNGNVFSDEGLCPTLTTNKGEGIKIQVKSERIAGWFENENVIGAYRDDAKSEEGKKQRKESLAKGVDYTPFQSKEIKFEESDVMNCITTATTKDNLIQVSEHQQALEINGNGTSNCLTSVQKDNLVITEIIQLNNPNHSNDRIYSDEGISPTLNTMQGGNRQQFIENNFIIRKLTVRECARLQGFPEEFDLSKVSNSQGYKQIGNTISVNVIQAILNNLLK